MAEETSDRTGEKPAPTGSPSTPAASTSAPTGGSPITGAHPQTGAQAVIANATDPARRPDVLLRKRRAEGHEISPWWLIGAFVLISGAVIALLSLVPGGI